jgi:hypothetical protein
MNSPRVNEHVPCSTQVNYCFTLYCRFDRVQVTSLTQSNKDLLTLRTIVLGLFEKPAFVDSALVQQADPKKSYDLDICATPLTMGKGGIVEYAIPTLNEFETKLLEESK